MKLEINSTPQNVFNHYNFPAGMLPEDTTRILDAGIQFAKEGHRAEARALLMRVTESEPQNESAWLWMASISDYPEELIVFLQKILAINPQNVRALEWLTATKILFAKTFAQHGVNALQENRQEFALQCFLQALLNDPENEDACLEMAFMAELPVEKADYLERVLSINPANERALSEMRLIKREKAQGLLKKANAAAVSGKHGAAEEMLKEVFDHASELEDAWLLKAFLTAEFGEKISCYEKVLQMNPANAAAQAGLASLRALMQEDDAEAENAEPPAAESFVSDSFEHQQHESDSETEKMFFASSEDKSESSPETEEQTENFDENAVRKCTIMIVDDSPTIRRLVTTRLEKSGHDVLEAESGSDALAKINETKPDLILLDISMPEMDGYQVCKMIRGNELTKNVPVLLISGKDETFDKSRGDRAGSTGFISKPFGPEMLMRTVESYLN